MFNLTDLLLLICVLLLVSLHVRLQRWREQLPPHEGVFLMPPRLMSGDTQPEIQIQILNPLEVAEKESAFGRLLGKVSPNLIARQVYAKTAETIMHEFHKRGLRARIEVHFRENDKTPG